MMGTEMFSLVGYEVVSLIGQGGLGDVYEARQLSTGATVAVKVLRETPGEPAALHRLQRELEALTAIGGQSNVIRLLDVVDSEAGPALVMEFAPGGSIASLLLERARVLDTDEVVFIGEHVASALAAAHQHGIIHRDVKPQNLLIDAYGAVKLCDFGIAALTRSEHFYTRTTALSVRYASPEDLEQDAEVGEASDVFSLGATLLHLAHGAPPTLRERVQAWVPPGRNDPHADELDAVIAACLQPDPPARPTAAEVAHRLGDLGAAMSPRRRSLVLTLDQASEPEERPKRDDPSALNARPALDGAALESPDDHADGLPSPARSTVDVVPLTTPTSSGGAIPADESSSFDAADSARPTVRRPAIQSEKGTRVVSRVLTVVAVAAVAVLVGTLAWRFVLHRGESSPPTAVAARTIVERDDGAPSLDEAESYPSVVAGQCLGLVVGSTQPQVVSCAEVHDGEVLAVEAVPASLEGAFDAVAVKTAATDYCSGIQVPAPPGASLDGLKVLTVAPSAGSWERGDRRMLCILGAPGARIGPAIN